MAGTGPQSPARPRWSLKRSLEPRSRLSIAENPARLVERMRVFKAKCAEEKRKQALSAGETTRGFDKQRKKSTGPSFDPQAIQACLHKAALHMTTIVTSMDGRTVVDARTFDLAGATLPELPWVPANTHQALYPKQIIIDDSKKPPAGATVGSEAAAWRCLRDHAWDEVWNSSERKSCGVCGTGLGKMKLPLVLAAWDLTGQQWATFKGHSTFLPVINDLTRETVRPKGKHISQKQARMRYLLSHQFPGMSNEQLHPYWSRHYGWDNPTSFDKRWESLCCEHDQSAPNPMDATQLTTTATLEMTGDSRPIVKPRKRKDTLEQKRPRSRLDSSSGSVSLNDALSPKRKTPSWYADWLRELCGNELYKRLVDEAEAVHNHWMEENEPDIVPPNAPSHDDPVENDNEDLYIDPTPPKASNAPRVDDHVEDDNHFDYPLDDHWDNEVVIKEEETSHPSSDGFAGHVATLTRHLEYLAGAEDPPNVRNQKAGMHVAHFSAVIGAGQDINSDTYVLPKFQSPQQTQYWQAWYDDPNFYGDQTPLLRAMLAVWWVYDPVADERLLDFDNVLAYVKFLVSLFWDKWMLVEEIVEEATKGAIAV